MIDIEIWIALFAIAGILYLMKWLQSRRKVTVYRISPKSLEISKRVMLSMLPLIENEHDHPLDETMLPYPKENIKSAAKILAYYYWKENRHSEVTRIKNGFIALSRFQNSDLSHEGQTRRAQKEKTRLTREFECYLTHSPYKTGKAT